jgi:membrane-associated phospholipid phosphatase|tara:strand:+ start:25798 stop:26310 length:513 start_codon:yes stop_codon:yes gene_type:complete
MSLQEFFTQDVSFIKILDLVGFLGPFLLLLIAIWQLWNHNLYWSVYLVIFVISSFINKLLKMIIKEPRPSNGESIINEDYSGHEEYGMPSAHAQSVFLTLTFLYLVKDSPVYLIGELFIACLTLFQRYKYNRHTIEQLGIGAFVGICIAYISYNLTTNYLQENTCKKNIE